MKKQIYGYDSSVYIHTQRRETDRQTEERGGEGGQIRGRGEKEIGREVEEREVEEKEVRER